MFLNILRAVVTMLNLSLFAAITFFLAPLSWKKEDDQANIIGFGFILCIIVLDMVLIWF